MVKSGPVGHRAMTYGTVLWVKWVYFGLCALLPQFKCYLGYAFLYLVSFTGGKKKCEHCNV
jgi:hypothetical protein